MCGVSGRCRSGYGGHLTSKEEKPPTYIGEKVPGMFCTIITTTRFLFFLMLMFFVGSCDVMIFDVVENIRSSNFLYSFPWEAFFTT